MEGLPSGSNRGETEAPILRYDSAVLFPGTVEPSIWTAQRGQGFQKGTTSATISGGVGVGLRILGSRERHDLALLSWQVNRIMTDPLGPGKWYHGNLELGAELFVGAQFWPEWAYLVGGTPAIRYIFATGTRWAPFLDAGAGIAATDIGLPDLSTTFEFHLRAGGGTHIFLSDNMAVTLQNRFAHLSNARLRLPNRGVNGTIFLVGITWFF